MTVWPAGLGQERHWSYSRRFPDSAGFNIPIATLVRGEVDLGALEAAIRAVTVRHESLRARFAPGPRRLGMILCPPEDLPVHRHDLRRMADPDRLLRLREIASAEAARPFDLGREPATRAHLIRMADRELVLVLNVHHIAFDGWSSPLFFAELDDQYRAIVAGERPRRPEPTHRYVDFARWQRQRVASGTYAGQVDYWREELAGDIPPAAWPAEGVDEQAPWWAADMVWLRPPRRLIAEAERTARSLGTTLFTLGMATYHLAMRRLLDAPRLAVGTALAGRTQQRWEEVIGFFVNTAVMPYDFDGDISAGELAARTHKKALSAQQNQDIPFGVVLDELNPVTVPDRTPYFQTMFLLQNYPSPRRKVGSAEARSRKLVTGSARYDVTFALDTLEGDLALELEYRTAWVSQETAIALARCFFGLLAAIVDAPDEPLRRLEPAPVELEVHHRHRRDAGLDELFSGLVANWRLP